MENISEFPEAVVTEYIDILKEYAEVNLWQLINRTRHDYRIQDENSIRKICADAVIKILKYPEAITIIENLEGKTEVWNFSREAVAELLSQSWNLYKKYPVDTGDKDFCLTTKAYVARLTNSSPERVIVFTDPIQISNPTYD